MGIFFDSEVLEVKVRVNGVEVHEKLEPSVDVRGLNEFVVGKWGHEAILCSYMTMASDTYSSSMSKPWQFWRQVNLED